MPSLHLVQRGYRTCIAYHENRCDVPFVTYICYLNQRCAMAYLLLVTDMSHISYSAAQLEMLSTCNTGGYSALYRACVLGRTMIYRAPGWPCPPEEDTRWWWSTNMAFEGRLFPLSCHSRLETTSVIKDYSSFTFGADLWCWSKDPAKLIWQN